MELARDQIAPRPVKHRTALSPRARVYTLAVMVCGACLLATAAPAVGHAPPSLLLLLIAAEAIVSPFKVKLPLMNGRATMSLTYAVDFTSLLLLAPAATMVVAMVGAWTQCTFNSTSGSRTSPYQTLFSMAAIAISVGAAGAVFKMMNGVPGVLAPGFLASGFVAAVSVYFLVNTALVGGAIALSSGQRFTTVWHDNFLWAAPSYFLSAAAATIAAAAILRGSIWFVPLAIAPLGLTYWAYRLYLGRYSATQQHALELAALHEAAVSALERARSSEQMLAVQTDRLATTLRTIRDGVVKTDSHGLILYMNPVAELLSSCPPHALVGQPLADVLPFVDVSDDSQPAHGRRITLTDITGAGRVIEQTRSPIPSVDGSSGFVWVFRDVTDAVRLEEERLKAIKLDSLAVLAGGIAHDFNNILTAVTGNLQFAMLGNDLDEDSAEALAAAERSCARAVGLTKQLLTFSKGGAPVKTTASVAELIRECTEFVLHGSNIACEFVIPDDLWTADLDTGQFSQVVHNLVINARQAMPAGGTIRIACWNVADTRWAAQAPPMEGPCLALSITDEGTGIRPEHLAKIFDPYFTTKAGGNGLGLATSYSIVKAHGGHISVTSTLGKGTCFVIHLPASTSQDRRGVDVGGSVSATTSGRVLIMDDEEEVRNVAVRLLKRLGYEPEGVSDGRAAITQYVEAQEAGRRFDIVMMDLTVPGGMGGLETIEQLRRIDPSVTAIVSSGYSDSSAMADFAQFGFQAVISKPYTLAEFRATFERLAVRSVSRV